MVGFRTYVKCIMILYMAETEDQPKEEPKSSSLADRLFGKALGNSAAEHLEKAGNDLSRGATDQANEHLKRAGMEIAHTLTNMASPRLTENENQEWLHLQQMKYRVSKDGIISTRFLDERGEQRIGFLNRKAFGQDTNT